MIKILLPLALLSLVDPARTEVSWPQFRGANCQGVAENEKPPIHFGADSNVLWKTPIPPGVSSPVVFGGRIFLTALEEGKLVTIGLDRATGKILWKQAAPAEKIEAVHKKGSPASATCATDGTRVYSYFGSFGLLAYDFEGKEQWKKKLPIGVVRNGSGTSPVLMKGRLVVNCDQDYGKSFLLAAEPATGKTIFEIPRPDFESSYTTPVLWKHPKGEDIVVAASLRVVGYDWRDGKERWSSGGLEAVSVAPTPVVGEDQLYVMSRSFGGSTLPPFALFALQADTNGDGKLARSEAPKRLVDDGAFDGVDRDADGFVTEAEWEKASVMIAKGEHGIFALRSPGEGDITSTHVAWKHKKAVATVSSPLFYKGRVYVAQDGGRLTCYNAKSGEKHYEQERLGADGEYFASPVAANDHIYLCSTKGTVTIARDGPTLDVKARNVLGSEEGMQATPALADNTIYIRTARHIWAFK